MDYICVSMGLNCANCDFSCGAGILAKGFLVCAGEDPVSFLLCFYFFVADIFVSGCLFPFFFLFNGPLFWQILTRRQSWRGGVFSMVLGCVVEAFR